ncbi:hypothetical protein [Streptomyces sp. SBT349]|uniref:hypothetical protein n=1 Tax=Streptomyces sp. SBT349 TaxID=1580539 RepID=UPI00131CDA29|nr:hypothetical protein [Streptomyces sp. SBT349]
MSGEWPPALERLGPYQLMGFSCALCGTYLGARARELGTVRHPRFGYPFRLWACVPSCLASGPVPRRPSWGGVTPRR